MTLAHKLAIIGFSQDQQNTDLYYIETPYRIEVEILESGESGKINYGSEIKNWHKSTLQLTAKKPENLVVLECVVRLLKKKYLPTCIELEKTWDTGHGTSGRLDIFLKDQQDKAYALIECKTYGEEYAKERNEMLEDGGQLFTYFVQDISAKTLVLYASSINETKIKYQAEAVNTDKLTGTNVSELYVSWDKSFIEKGIFEENAQPYFSQKRNIIKAQLKELDKDTGKGLFNSFAEILRRHVVSDKSNAFNKIFNLFVCKIYDEDTKTAQEELDFQWKVNDTFVTLITRLQKLYIKGLSDYLQVEIKDSLFSPYSEFSFTDIFNEETYNRNFTVVKEVVELLQGFQIKYTNKQQYLGDFFENLLATGIKQEAGQFFTPIPLARFFLKSLPIDTMIQEKIQNKDLHILPYIIDYACGSGHFLTEGIDEIEQEISKIKVNDLVGRIQKHFLAIKENFFWAKEYVYGIEKDYRLAKTTKIAMFLNGDGDAIIVNGDGLDDFYKSKTYTGVLKTGQAQAINPQFDILVSNPPFSIAGFKQYLKNGSKNFSLFQTATSKSSEIECFFIERIYQLLKENGCAGIILPLSILNSENRIYVEARKMLLVHFSLKGLVELRDKTFIATNTTTVGIFLKKRTQTSLQIALTDIYNFCVKNIENTKLDKILETLISQNKWLKLDKEVIKSEFQQKNIDLESIKKGFLSTQLSEVLALLLFNYLANNEKTVIAYSGEKKEQIEFLGYRFSNSRGSEGLDPITDDNGLLNSRLYDTTNNYNPDKINTYIRNNFVDKTLSIPENLQNNLDYIATTLLIEKSGLVLNNPSNYFVSENYVINSNSRLGDFIEDFEQQEHSFEDLLTNNDIQYLSGLVYNKKAEVPRKTDRKVLTASNIDLQTGTLIFEKIIYLKEDFELPNSIKPTLNDIIISSASGSLKHLGKVAFVKENITDSVIGGFLSIIRAKDEFLAKALFYRLLSYKFRKFVASLRDQNINNMNLTELKNFSLTLPKDLELFYNQALLKEKELERLENELLNLKNK